MYIGYKYIAKYVYLYMWSHLCVCDMCVCMYVKEDEIAETKKWSEHFLKATISQSEKIAGEHSSFDGVFTWHARASGSNPQQCVN